MSDDRPWPTSEWHPGNGEPRAIPHARIPAGGYWRPNTHIWQWFMVPPAMRAAAYYGVAACATSILCGIKVWRALTEHHDEIGD